MTLITTPGFRLGIRGEGPPRDDALEGLKAGDGPGDAVWSRTVAGKITQNGANRSYRLYGTVESARYGFGRGFVECGSRSGFGRWHIVRPCPVVRSGP
jgi:hypothetical protein